MFGVYSWCVGALVSEYLADKVKKTKEEVNMFRRSIAGLVVFLLAFLLVVPAFAKGGRAGDTGVIYVTSQGLYYDTFAPVDALPMQGRFQKLEMGPNGPQTEFGPGDSGYLGGRWWVDENGNGIQDEGDTFFLCPLLGPGRPTP
jgi:hypothetical protein